MICKGLMVVFYGRLTLSGYLMPNPVYTYIKYVWFSNWMVFR